MNWSASIYFREHRLPHGCPPVASASGRMIMELGFWILGIALIAAWFAATTTLEHQRSQGLELFAEARAAARVSDRLEDLPLADQSLPVQDGQAVTPVPVPASTADAASLPIAVLRIASVGLEVPVYPDISELNLNRGAGWIEGTAAPNAGGNMAVAAHRDQYFRPLKDIQVGDILELESLSGLGEFRVSRILVVDPHEVSVLDDTAVPTLTLVTCYPFYFIGNAPQRYIVQAIAVDPPEKVSASDTILTVPPSGETS